jgi:glycosyltransferase involved in cell wall biosynthesis
MLWRWISRHAPQVLFDALGLGYNLYAWIRLRPLLIAGQDIVYYERNALFLFAGVWLAKRRGIPVLLEVNELAGLGGARGTGAERIALERIALMIERFVLEQADQIIVVSSLLAEEARQRTRREKPVHVVPNAVDPRHFDTATVARSVRDELGLADSDVVGFVGWFDYWDRLDMLVEVVSDLRSDYPKLRLLLVGDGPVISSVRDRVQDLGLGDHVQITGPVPRDRLPEYVAAMDIGVLPYSNSFGSPIVLFELMAMGKAVVAPDLAPIRDVMVHEETGLVVPPGDRAAMSGAIARLARDRALRDELGRRARERVLGHHTWERNAQRVARIADDLVRD